jgi:ferredoxin-like protein FixX
MKVKVIAKRTTYVECEIDVKDYAGDSKEEQIEWYAESKNFSGKDLFNICYAQCGYEEDQLEHEYEGHTELVKEKE